MRTNTGNIYIWKVDHRGIHRVRWKKRKKDKVQPRDLSSDLGKYNLTINPLMSKRDFMVNNFSAKATQRNIRSLING